MDSHSDGTHSLQMIHWWACDVMLNFSKSVLTKNQTHIWGWVHFQKSFEFWVNYSFNYDLPISYDSVNIWISTCVSHIIFLETMCSHLKTHVFCKRDEFRLPSLIWQHIPLKSRPWWMVLNMTFAYRWPTANSVARLSGQNIKSAEEAPITHRVQNEPYKLLFILLYSLNLDLYFNSMSNTQSHALFLCIQIISETS